jgi:hypothetical protein
MAEVCAGADEGAHGSGAVGWVDAAPFRAQLIHLMSAGDLSVEVVAVLTGISVRGARHLLSGRAGRPVRRISVVTGRRLLRVSGQQARTVRQRQVCARGAAHQLRELTGAGVPLSELARHCGVAESLLAELAADRLPLCSTLLAAQVFAAHSALDVGDEVGYPLAS